ncbi:cytochrome c oxidase assembly protein subunit 15 [Evansella caseinilytica]|uniref:Heme A synthase n=1 Tax=Evansella caseinilytica TaxID=1503961 RepID=A0A1H3MM30_9BACI|nr:heme A synthase [Evansella caseinilytica]SDY77458.1 cytochrome c oxidase assembly protein subunit 15 [Evansella caseinilytica]
MNKQKVGGAVKHLALKIYGIITSLGMLVVLLQGALVTQTGSGDACGAEWPLCYGQVIPKSPTIETLIEYSHRVVSGLLGLMVVILAIWAWRKLKHIKETKFFAIMSVLFIILQGLLGAAAVVWGQTNAVMALHFGFSLISFTTVLLLTILAFEDGKPAHFTQPRITARMKNYIYFVLVYIYVVVYTGAYVRHTGSSIACSGWPLCNGQLIPPLEGRVAVQFSHRVAAGILFIVILMMFIHLHRHYREQKSLYYSGAFSLLFVTVQVISGAIVVFTGFTLAATLFHAFFISVLFGIVSYTAMLAYRAEKTT